jgi:hypothetical protein
MKRSCLTEGAYPPSLGKICCFSEARVFIEFSSNFFDKFLETDLSVLR